MTRLRIGRMLGVLAALLFFTGLRAQEDERVFRVFNASNGLADNSAQTIRCTKTGRMVISTIGHINFYDGNNFTHIDPTPADVFPLPAYNGHYHMYFDKHHHLWLKDKLSVTCVDLLMERFVSDVGSVIKGMGVSGKVDDMYGDQNNLVWFRTGDTLYCPALQSRVAVKYKAELQDVDVHGRQLLQFFADGTVKAFDVSTGRPLFTSSALEGADTARYASSGVMLPHAGGFYQIRNGEQESVLLDFDIEKRQWKKMMELPYHLNNMVEHRGRLYLASEYGYWVVDLTTGDRKHVESLQLTGGRKLLTDINVLAFDRQGGMWVGTERRGLLYARPFEPPVKAYDWQQPEALRYYQMIEDKLGPERGRLERRLNCVYKDSRGWTWRGTYTGLQLIKKDGAAPENYSQADGLTNDVVHCVVEGADGDIWAGTSYGICRIYIDDGQVTHIESYVNSDNVPNESFVNGRAICLDDGTIVMQSLDHMVVISPNDFHDAELRSMKIYPKLVRVMVNGNDVKAGEKVDGTVVLERAPSRSQQITISDDQNSVSLTFSGLNYMRPLQTYYRVRVKGVKGFSDWRILSVANSGGLVDGHGLLHLPLMGIKPGTYRVELQASITPSEWDQEPYIWYVKVQEPWWRTTGVYLLLTAVLMGLLITNFIFYNRNLRLRMQRNNEEANVLHRLRGFAERCEALSNEVLTPYSVQAEGSTANDASDQTANAAYVDAMVRIVPYINSHKSASLTIAQLAQAVGMETSDLYQLMAENTYENPRMLLLPLRLKEAEQLLADEGITIEEVAEVLGFVSPNYFIACFYHHYRQTPADYRKSIAR